MELWTIQTEEAYQILLNTGTLRNNPDKIYEDFIQPYKWIVKQMDKRIKNHPDNIEYPLWAWYQWNDSKHRKPDLRYHHIPKGEKGVRIHFKIDDDLVLLSDYSTWHYILNGWYLPISEEDSNKYEDILNNDEMELSWERIFDLNWYDKYINEPKDKKAIQAVFWELKLDWVEDIKRFVSR